MKMLQMTLLMLCAILFAALPLVAETEMDGGYTWTYTIDGGTASIWSVSPSPQGAVTIPSTLGGNPVTSIGPSLFMDCSELTSVTIPDGVTDIDVGAFSNCCGLTSVTIPDSVMRIRAHAFERCNELLYDKTAIPGVILVDGWTVGNTDNISGVLDLDGIRGIGDESFRNCADLARVTIPDTVTSIGESTFMFCSELEHVTIPDTVTSIGVNAFGGCEKLESVVIPESVTNISGFAFFLCTNLKSVIIPDSVSNIGDNAFGGCENIEVFHGLRFGDRYADEYIPINSLQGTLREVSISSKVDNIADYTFNYFLSLTNVVIGSGVTNIGESAFADCTALSNVTIPESVASIRDGAFVGCSSLEAVHIPNSVTNVGNYSFGGCTNLTSVTIPQCLCVGGERYYDNQLREVFDDETLEGIAEVTIADGAGEIGWQAFRDFENLRSVIIPGSVTNIAEFAFEGCSGLTNLTLSEGIVNINVGAFADCVGLTRVVIPDSVTSIGESAFAGCTGLTELVIGNGVTIIGWGAFRDCCGLQDVVIPDSVNIIGSEAFYGCTALTSVTLPQCLCVDAEEYSQGNYRESKFCVAFDTDTITKVVISTNVNRIGTRMFYGCANLREVYIPDGVASIGMEAFSGCSALSRLILPDSVVRVESRAFSGCSGLTNLSIPDGATAIVDGAFSGCNGLTFVAIPQMLCDRKLSSLFPESYQSIKTVYIQPTTNTTWRRWTSDVFSGCTNLANVAFSVPRPPPAMPRLSSQTKISFPVEYASAYSKVVTPDQFAGYVYRDISAFATGGDSDWSEDIYTTNAGDRSFCSGMISDNGCSWIEMTIPMPGRISFYWKASTERYGEEVFDYAFLSVDGIPKGTLTEAYKLDGIAIGGAADWTNVVFDVAGDGSHTIRWTYLKDDLDEGYVGEDHVWLDWFTFIPKPTVSFDIGDHAAGVCPSPIREYSVERVALPQGDGFSRDNHVFGGWSDGAAIIQTGSEYVVPPTNVVLTAYWIPVMSVSFDIGNGAGVVPETIKTPQGTYITLPSADYFELADHVFDGWIYNGRMYNAGQQFKVTDSDVTFAARWIAKSFVSFDIAGGEGSAPEEIKELPGAIVVLPTGDGFSRKDHVFDGWSDGEDSYEEGAEYIVPDTNVTLSAKWIAKSFVVFDIGEGLGEAPETIKEVPNTVVALPNGGGFEWEDHVFFGWDFDGRTYEFGTAEWNNFVVPSSNVTLTAHWLAKSFVSFEIGESSATIPDTIKALPGATVVLPAADGLKWEDHVFDCWTDGAVNYAPGADYIVPCTNVTMYAVWIAKSFLTFTLDGGDGEIPIVIKDVPDAKVTLPGCDGFRKAKHTFVGWSDGALTYDAGAEYVVTKANVEFTAVWAAKTLLEPMISSEDVANGDTIEAAYATVEISADEFSVIYYTLDGTDPTTNSYIYVAPVVADGMYVQIKAIAVRDDYYDSPVAEFSFSRMPYSAAECINAYGEVVSTGNDDAAWERVIGDVAHDGTAALRSGEIGEGESTSVEMCVTGAGEIRFWWKASCERVIRGRPNDHVAFLVDDISQGWLGGLTDWSNVVVTVSGEGSHVLKWVYQNNGNSVVENENCAWLDEVTWTPADPLPALDSAATDNDAKAIIAGLSDVRLSDKIDGTASYIAFRSWVDSKGLSHDLVKDAPNAWLSYVLDAPGLMAKAAPVASEDVVIESIVPSSITAGAFDLAVDIAGVEIGEGATSARLAEALGVEGAAELNESAFSSDGLTVGISRTADGKARATVMPDGTPASFFLRVRVE